MLLLSLPFFATAAGILGYATVTHPRVARHENFMWGVFTGCCIVVIVFVALMIADAR